MSLDHFLTDTREQLEAALTQCFAQSASSRLRESVLYSLLDGGKRLRPALVRAAAEVVEAPADSWLSPACALEMVHVYSLIHDDLPAMDNDDLRRGKPTNHKQFDEATAILAGDALQAEAFLLLATAEQFSNSQARQMITTLAQAAGAGGMVGGQMIDLQSEHKTLSLTELENLHALKTGALIKAALQLGALCQPQPNSVKLAALNQYGSAIGLAFQITDDILDVTASTEVLGKPQGSDVAAEKSTYVSLLGLDGARQKAQEQQASAIAALQKAGLDSNSLLWQLADYVLQRDH
ncbi:polyprenyl synthetase family protein [Reinekea marinisedimentorum]|uniref:Geranylgeranyl diphosphate synthase type II n=1 Tax=Reinekea marinisedimentorum TaxID=230495 RepID=A0A4R3ICN5_9GAMM|nr:farnesyl diphosphate synthase [Reinekea marinisedimentorum]TCS43167.1 geranylgeranyl diphosphate synthase type II [Reinekea marinisedimentorum]